MIDRGRFESYPSHDVIDLWQAALGVTPPS
jgi:hypothetical protein